MNTKTQTAKEPTLANAIVAYMDAMKVNYITNAGGGEYHMEAEPGQKFIRLVHRIDWNAPGDGQRSCHCFIVKKAFTNKQGLSFKVGDILASASWYAPAINKTLATTVRGNVLTRDYGKSRWTGAGYAS